MTGDKSVFHTFIPCTQNLNVWIADGSLSKVVGTGTVVLEGGLSLHHVLFVPKLNCCLISVSKLTLDNNCMVKFFPSMCEFLNLDSGKMIGSAKGQAGLYSLHVQPSSSKSMAVSGPSLHEMNSYAINTPHSETRTDSDRAIMMWHYRPGHPNFMYLSKMFPTLFINFISM
ncbi:hypothetical protein ACOSQ2_018832 [Xanthoceras sorbifolium]